MHRDSTKEHQTRKPSRRQFLKGVATTSLVGATASQATAQEVNVVFELGGDTQGWRGRSPAAIEGIQNPTLPLSAGTTYKVRWENVDGLPHNFVILDADGNTLLSTEIIEAQGAVQEVQFTASEEMASYYCQVHPSTMEGDITLGCDPTAFKQQATPNITATTANETTTANATGTPTETEAVGVDRGEPIEIVNTTDPTTTADSEFQNRQEELGTQKTYTKTAIQGTRTTVETTTQTACPAQTTGTNQTTNQNRNRPTDQLGFGIITGLAGLVGVTSYLSQQIPDESDE